MSRPSFDLQAHSIHSDGMLPAREVVERAAAAGVELLALSDHDTVDGVQEASAAARELGIRNVPAAEVVQRAAAAGVELLALSDHDTVDGVPEALDAAKAAGIRLTTAVEISSVQDEHEDLHILGYGVDHTDPHLLAELERYRGDREVRADRMRAALEELGWAIDPAPLERRREQGKPIGRPHLAQAAFGHPANADRIREEGLEDFSALLVASLIPGGAAYRRREFPTVEEAIALIHDAGGVAVWAHPFWDLDADPEVLASIDRFQAMGLDGVEVFYVTHTREQVDLLAQACTERGLLMTGSSDFHGPEHRHFPGFLRHELHGHTPVLGPIAELG